jgi:hypothetical protein
MIRFTVSNGKLTPVLAEEATQEEKDAASLISDRLNAFQGSAGSYKSLMEGIDTALQSKGINTADLVDQETITEIESFYEQAAGIKPWDSTKDGASLDNFDAKFYSGVVPDKQQAWKDASKAVSFGGQKIADIDITKRYPDLDSYLHADYTFVGAPSGLPGKQKQLTEYTETLRPPTDRERQILRETLLGASATQPVSLVEQSTQQFVDTQGEQVFGALSADVLKQTLDEYSKNLKQEQMSALLGGMGLSDATTLKQDIKNTILGDLGAGGFTSFSKGISESLDKSLGLGSSVKYNWQDWFDKTLAERYRNMQEIQDPGDAEKTYKIEQEFANNFIEDYLKPRFDTSKSISEFISYMDVTADEQNVLQTQLASSALKDFANKQANTFLNDLATKTTSKTFDPKFYLNPEIISGTDVTNKAGLYASQKADVDSTWQNRESTNAVKDGKTWKQLAYEYGLDLNNQDDFARLHYEILGKDKGYDPVADTYTRNDLAAFIQGDLSNALQNEKALYGNPVFLDFVTADAKTQELVDKLNLKDLPEEYLKQLEGAGLNPKEAPVEQIKAYLSEFLRTQPATEIREQIRILNEQQIKPTQEQLGIGYIQRDTDENPNAPAGGTALFNIFKKAGYTGSESEFYTDFFPDATEEDKNLGKVSGTVSKTGTAQDLFGFSMPDMSDPFTAMASIEGMFGSTESQKTELPTKENYFNIFTNEVDEGAPSYFKIKGSTTTTKVPSPQDFLGDFSSIFG